VIFEDIEFNEQKILVDLMDRRTFIGGSDAPVILNVSPWKSRVELWLEKTGQAEPPDISEVERVVFGQLLEEVIASEFCRRNGAKVRRVNDRQVSKTHPWAVAQIDRRIVGGGILECKSTDKYMKRFWNDGVPDYVLAQVYHQQWVDEQDKTIVAALFGGNHMEQFEVGRNEKVIKYLIDEESRFEEMVQKRIAPEPISTADAAALWQHPDSVPVMGSAGDVPLFKKWFELKKLEEETEVLKDAILLEIQKRMENLGDVFTVFGIEAAQWKVGSRTSIDTKALKEKYPEIAKELSRTTTQRPEKPRILASAETLVAKYSGEGIF
jgi:putative phage-type endonuclease